MTLDDLRAFLAVCEAGSLSAVARDLSCTQSAVSQRVRRLERELGLPLLKRQPRGVAPTPAGRLLRHAAHDGIGALDLAVRQLREIRDGVAGTVRITTGAISVRHFMSQAVVSFRARHPQVGLEFQTSNSGRGCLDALAADTADLAWITIGPPVRGVQQRPVTSLPWVLAVRADDPLATRVTVGPDDLADIRHIHLPENSTSRRSLDGHFAQHGTEPDASTSVADWDTAMLLAELGLGHAIVPALPGWRAAEHPGLRLIPIPSPPLATGWAVRRWDTLSPAALAFADAVATSLTPPPPATAAPPPRRHRGPRPRPAHPHAGDLLAESRPRRQYVTRALRGRVHRGRRSRCTRGPPGRDLGRAQRPARPGRAAVPDLARRRGSDVRKRSRYGNGRVRGPP